MRSLYALLLSIPMSTAAQTIWPVQVGGSTIGGTPPFYNPQNLTIQVGDIVQWTNTSGTHNVNGSLSLFPANPEGFSSGNPQGGTWTFSHTFTIAGVYNYHCTQQGHSATQFGSITVQNSTGLSEIPAEQPVVSLFPVPTDGTLIVDITGTSISEAEVFAMDGRRVLTLSVNGGSRLVISMHALSAGHYVLRMRDGEGRSITRPFRKE